MPSTLIEQAAPYKIKLLENNLGELENKGWLSQTTFYIFVHARKRLKSIDSFKVTTAHVIRCAFLHPRTRAPVIERARTRGPYTRSTFKNLWGNLKESSLLFRIIHSARLLLF